MALPYVTPGQLALVENKINNLNEKLTDEDIDSVKAVQSPKNATANQVLTADGNGKAVYKDAAATIKFGQSIHSTGTTNARLLTDSTEHPTMGAYVSISTEESCFDWPNGAKSILGIVSPNINFLKVNDKYICPTRLHYQYGSGKYCYIYIPKDIVTEFGITEELNQIAYDWYPVAAFIPNK